jgi:hypothetical protein
MKQAVAVLLIAIGVVAYDAPASTQPLPPPHVTLQPPDPPGMPPRSGTYREPSAGRSSLINTTPSRPQKRARKPRNR